MSPETAGLQRSFALDSDILAPGSAFNVDLSGSTAADVALAIVKDDPFPEREDGEIALGQIGLGVSGGNPVAFSGSGTTVGFEFSAGITAGAGIFDRPDKAIAALGLAETPGLSLSSDGGADARYAVLRAGYKASGEVKGTHPIGAVGSLSFGVSGAASGLSAVVHRFAKATGARSVLDRTVHAWKLPRHVDSAAKLQPGTWVLTEADGTIAAQLSASLGYNFNFIQEAKLAGLSGDIGLKIDAAATATFGVEISGRYLVALGRESEAERVRLQMFKLSRKGLNAGQNLKIGVTGVETVSPDSVDDFVSAVFGVHGAQIAGVLQKLDKWTDPEAEVKDLVAGLAKDKAKELLHNLTGSKSDDPFPQQKDKLVGGLKLLDKLPPRVSSELLGLLPKLDDDAMGKLRGVLALLGSDDREVQKEALKDLLNKPAFASTPAGRIIMSLGEKGVLALLDKLGDVKSVSGAVGSILDNGVVQKLQQFVGDRLSLDKVLKARTPSDFEGLDSFLLGRLSAFFGKEITFSDLEEVRESIHLVLKKRADVYNKVQKALNSRYGLDVSATWQQATAKTAVLDVVFDTSKDQGRALLASVVREAEFDLLMTSASDAVEIRSAVLTHELTRKTEVDVTLPYFASHAESFNNSMARVSAEDEGGRVLMYDATGQDVVAVRNKFRSSLSMSVAAAAPAAMKPALGNLRIHSTDGATWSYTLRHGKNRMKRAELEAFTRPFIEQYMAKPFAEAGSGLGLWYSELDRTVEQLLRNGADEFGDVCATLEVAMPGEILGAWLLPVADVNQTAKRVSLEVQRALKQVLPFYYLTDIARLQALPTSAALLAWASIEPSNDVRIEGDAIVPVAGKHVFWDNEDRDLRVRMVRRQSTIHALLKQLPPLRLRLEEAGMHRDAEFYKEDRIGSLLADAASPVGDTLLRNLLGFEAAVVHKAAEAVVDIQGFLAVSGTSPSKAIERLAEFAADLTTAFNKLIGNTVFASLSFRAVSQTVFAEASRALSSALTAQPRAMLVLSVLRPEKERTFRIADFLDGAVPPPKEVALEQHLVSI
jgi:hypothetical protein